MEKKQLETNEVYLIKPKQNDTSSNCYKVNESNLSVNVITIYNDGLCWPLMTLFIKFGNANENLCLLILPFKNQNKKGINKTLCL